ncbi:GNAT family N-acetyltransferase [Arthrobacter sp. HMWF013]|uniref:GNAT family N-acetyltransferase n=1 Tax=Arthrobacter sp. HMWF013 TaxID=2056849 RepID=UPI0015E82B27|nr:GNAT family N-acetyltransferase [Arthrobacter sp. HMWF013]
MILDGIGPLVTARLALRLVRASDAAAIHRFRGNPAATTYLSHGPLTEEANRERLVAAMALSEASMAPWFNHSWAIVLQESGEVVGDARTWNTAELTPAGVLAPGRHPAHHAALAYVLHPDHQHQGYGREAAAALVDWLFTGSSISTIVAGVYEPNTPSIRLLQSLGFRKDPALTDQPAGGKRFPLIMFSLDRPDDQSG